MMGKTMKATYRHDLGGYHSDLKDAVNDIAAAIRERERSGYYLQCMAHYWGIANDDSVQCCLPRGHIGPHVHVNEVDEVPTYWPRHSSNYDDPHTPRDPHQAPAITKDVRGKARHALDHWGGASHTADWWFTVKEVLSAVADASVHHQSEAVEHLRKIVGVDSDVFSTKLRRMARDPSTPSLSPYGCQHIADLIDAAREVVREGESDGE